MSKSNSIKPRARSKPAKPYPDYPLTPHNNGKWVKKIRGQLYYFGTWEDPDGALKSYLDQKDALHAGRRQSDNPEGLSVFTLCGKFLTTKKRLLEAGELSVHSFADYTRVCQLLIKNFHKNRLVADLCPDDFERLRTSMAKRLGPVKLGNEINRIRVVFNFGLKNGLLAKPMIYGEGFKRPSKKTLRKHRAEQGPKMFEAEEIRRMLGAATQPLESMLLLAINCGFGNSDVGTLPLTAIDLERGWLNYARPKTGIDRKVPLWPETVASLRAWLAVRPQPAKEEHAGLVFLTAKGGTWAKATSDNPVSKETRKLLDKLKINGHRNFYSLRHSFQTVGDEARDFLAVRRIMGHVSDDIADAYRERVTDERLLAVTNHVRNWLFTVNEPDNKKSGETKGDTDKGEALRLYTA
jgi:integrase